MGIYNQKQVFVSQQEKKKKKKKKKGKANSSSSTGGTQERSSGPKGAMNKDAELDFDEGFLAAMVE
eukprot:scaffold56706_cov54-Attheya_sp.AAC.6